MFCFVFFLLLLLKKEKGKIYFQVNHRQILVELNTVKKKNPDSVDTVVVLLA